MERNKVKKNPKGQEGFSLVELMLSAMILGLCLIGVSAMLHQGTVVDVSGDHRRQAKSLIHAEFEQSHYKFHNYNFLFAGGKVDTVTLDVGANYPLTAYLRTTVSNEIIANLGGVNIPYKEVTVSVKWSEAGTQDSISITKRVSDPT